MKILAASIALAMSGVANAAILQSSETIGSGELFLTAWDEVGQQSYSLDLGILQRDFMANTSQTLSYDLSGDAKFAPFMGNTGVVYTVTGGDDSFQVASTYGFVTTSRSGIDSVLQGAQNQSMIAGVVTKIDVMASDSNSDNGQPAPYNQTDIAANLSSYSIPGDNGYFDKGTWGFNLGGSPFVTTGTVDSSVAFYFSGIASDYITGVVTELPNVWTLTSTGQLTYAAAPSAVPVPAAVWLFGSGLLGLASIARRRKA